MIQHLKRTKVACRIFTKSYFPDIAIMKVQYKSGLFQVSVTKILSTKILVFKTS